MPPDADAPAASVIVVCWNSARYLPRTLAALAAQTYRNFEVIVVDNGSSDDATAGLDDGYPGLAMRLERQHSNIGFAAANNLAARLARGTWLALLNPDAFPAPDWLEQLLNAAASHPRAFFASRQLQAEHPDLCDGEGDTYHVSGLAWRRNYGTAVRPLEEPEEVFSACAAAALYPRAEFLAVGGFDEDYFAYLEDVDLGFRLRLQGWRCVLMPRAVVHHVGSASTGKTSDFAVYHGHRNLVWTFVKDMPSPLFWLYLPLHIAMNLFYVFSFSLKGKSALIFRAKRDACRGLSAALKKRGAVQSGRVATTDQIRRSLNRDLLAPLWARWARTRLGSHPT